MSFRFLLPPPVARAVPQAADTVRQVPA
jgi:hypothetical protein